MTPPAKPPEDHIFGDLDQPKNSVEWLIDRSKGVRHDHRRNPIIPQPGDAVQLFVTTSMDLPVESVYVWMSTDDWSTQTEAQFTMRKTTWETALWSYIQEWTIKLPPQTTDSMLRYKIGAKLQGSKTMIFADNQAQSFQEGTHYSIWYDGKNVPAWADDAIIYQIFVDRFNPGKGKRWLEYHDLRKIFGGTLNGVTEKLPLIRSMGFNAIWLTPICTSPTHHGYDISDYYQVNPRMGSIEDFKRLLDVAHQHQIRVILDFVANHCSNQHLFFLDAVSDPVSKYHDFFVWKQWPQYECFYNVRSMPKLNLSYGSPARDYLLKCAQYWLELGVDGFRLDYAHGPEQDFWVDFRRACSQVNPDHWTFAEIVQPADVQASYAGGVGGTLDFILTQAIRLSFGQQEWSLSKFGGFLAGHFDYFPNDFSLPSFIDNHDMNRFLVIANENERLLRLVLMVLYLLPGAPIIYYGTEVPLSQKQSIHAKSAQGFDEARLPMPWEAWNNSSLPDFLKKLAEIRHTFPSFHRTGWVVHQFDDQKEILALGKKDQDVFLLINRSNTDRLFALNVNGEAKFIDPMSQEIVLCKNGRLNVSVEACSGKLLYSTSLRDGLDFID